MHPIPRSAADILALAALARPARPKRSWKPKVDPFASDHCFTQFSVTASTSGSTPSSSSIPMPFSNISTETGTSVFYVPSSTLKFISTSTRDTFLKARGLDSEGEDSRIADSGNLTPCLPLPFKFKPQMCFTYIVAQYHLKQKTWIKIFWSKISASKKNSNLVPNTLKKYLVILYYGYPVVRSDPRSETSIISITFPLNHQTCPGPTELRAGGTPHIVSKIKIKNNCPLRYHDIVVYVTGAETPWGKFWSVTVQIVAYMTKP